MKPSNIRIVGTVPGGGEDQLGTPTARPNAISGREEEKSLSARMAFRNRSLDKGVSIGTHMS